MARVGKRASELGRLVEQRVAQLRPKLLDLSRRNPLISTNFSGRSNALLRIVDELPEKVWTKLKAGSMRFRALPDLENDPKDEEARGFLDALTDAKRLDEKYLAALADLDAKGEPDPGEYQALDRSLRDRVRAALGMEPRQTGADLSLAAHARAHGISPNFDLPDPGVRARDRRHVDADLQTLLLAGDLERRLDALLTKGKTWQQETGVNVMHMALGFVEWSDASAARPSFAPLLLAQVEIAKRKTAEGAEFTVKLVDEDLTLNAVLAQKFRSEFALDLPGPEPEEGLEAYFVRIAELQPHTLKLRLRRQIAFGVFPSARIAMFHDLAAHAGAIGQHPVVSVLLGGAETPAASPFAPEYPIDEIDITTGTPPTVLDADSSQLSAVIDVLNGKDMALEGPPGTGKSQTIVNVIAAAMAEGKKVLFIAEKMAALEVVQSRLRSLDLDGFVLPLQATRSTREQVILSLRERLAMRAKRTTEDRQAALNGFKRARAELADYLTVLASHYRSTGWTVHDVLGRGMGANVVLDGAPAPLVGKVIASIDVWTNERVEAARKHADAYQAVRMTLAQVCDVWRGVGRVAVDRFSLEAMRGRAAHAGRCAGDIALFLKQLPDVDAPLLRLVEDVGPLARALGDAQGNGVDLRAVARAAIAKRLDALTTFSVDCARAQSTHDALAAMIDAPLDGAWPQRLERLAALTRTLVLESLDPEIILSRIDAEEGEAARLDVVRSEVDAVVAVEPFWGARPLADMVMVRRIAENAGPAALLMRHAGLVDPALRARVREAVSTGMRLAGERAALAHDMTDVPQEDFETLRAAAMTLRGAGFWARMGKAFKEARSLYRRYASDRRFDRLAAANRLQRAADYKQTLAGFETEAVLPTMLGSAWRGLETNFSALEATTAFADALEAACPGLVNRPFRLAVLGCDIEVLQSLPKLDAATAALGTPAELARRCAHLRESAAALTAAQHEIRELASGLKDLEGWRTDRLDDTAKKLSALQALAARLDRDELCRDVLADAFAGWRTPRAVAERIADVASNLNKAGLGSTVATALLAHPPERVVWVLTELAPKLAALDAALFEIGDAGRFINRVRSLRAAKAAETLEQAATDHESLQAHAELALHRHDLDAMQLGAVLDEIEGGWTPAEPLADIVASVVYRAMALDVYETHGAILGRFAGTRIDQLRKEIADLDAAVVRLTRDAIRRDLLRRADPPAGVTRGRVAERTEMGLIENEIAKSRAFIPVRSLVDRAGQALLELKPCWMMSPLAVAQYVPAHMQFDLCIIDEASQMPPEDALGAVLRSKQVMVVGDTNQLPPTTFFRKLIDDGDDEDSEGEAVVEESILELANAVFRPSRRLRWHYRSRHGSLIAFSNNHIYDDNLIVFPSADDRSADRGVSLVQVDGRYRSSVNPEEAKAIVAAAVEFMIRHPDRSLGLVTVNQKQRDLIREELNTAISLDERANAYIERWAAENQGLEEFFVKNLENVQGDERDAIFISTVYGPAEPGQTMPQRFGPIAGVAGRRRLNVLFSRAKQQLVTFTSMRPTNITADEHGNAGAYMLRCWLEYAATGVIARGESTGREPDSEFEVFVARQLASMGVDVQPQVGVAGYFVDIGVRHPDWPYGYLLGVECDGASYHSAPSARDRDRLRESVLEGLGWRIHRIWSTDWFTDPGREARRLRAVIDARLGELRSQMPPTR